jgi:hypothetical protein
VYTADEPVGYSGYSEATETHRDVLLRILFIYAKLNPGIMYVQGMNELLAPIYYVFSVDEDVEWSAHAEADAFYCFTNIMSHIRDRYRPTNTRVSVHMYTSHHYTLSIQSFNVQILPEPGRLRDWHPGRREGNGSCPAGAGPSDLGQTQAGADRPALLR